MSDPAIYLRNIERCYQQGGNELAILRGAELAVWPGQSVALIAPSGAGKSTLLQIAGLLEKPDGGEVFIGREATSHLNDEARTTLRRLDIGFVYQFHHLLPIKREYHCKYQLTNHSHAKPCSKRSCPVRFVN